MIRAAAFFAVLLLAGTAHAQDRDHRLRWSADWSRVHPASYAAVGAAVGGALVFDYVLDPGPEALFRGPEIFDEGWRTRLMAPREADRERAATLSDVLLGVVLAWPVIDALGVAGLGDLNSDVAWQLTMIAAESFAADLLISTVAKQLVARERPHGMRCTLEDRLENPRRCGPGGRLRSFYSGHSSAAFNGAGLVCVMHTHLPLYGSQAADLFACGAALLTAGVVATLRVVADRHYATDVLVGSILGLATGFLLPYLLHFRWDPEDDAPPDVTVTARPLTAPVFSLGGSF